jgi:NAD(P)-dependent dehydrogenase (short-subunit alcohol dehydrogenase family)
VSLFGGWTARDIPDQHGRRIVVTGASSGLGLETARELVRHGASVVLAVRDPTRGANAAADIERTAPGAPPEVRPLDLADLASVRAFAGAWDGPLDVLVNNAGVMALPYGLTADGFEMQFGTNHLGHFALTGLLLPALLAAPAPRVVTVSSGVHHAGSIDFEDLQHERSYQRWQAYSASKLANLLFAFELQRRVDGAGLPLLSVAAHPGYAATNLQLAGPRMEGRLVRQGVMSVGNLLLGQSAAKGALPQLYAATAGDVRGGEYFGPRGLMEGRGSPTRVKGSSRANDPELARKLWDVSEDLTGVRFEALDRSP